MKSTLSHKPASRARDFRDFRVLRAFLLLALLALPLSLLAAPGVKATLSARQILIGQQLTLSLEINAPQGVAVVFPDVEGRKMSDVVIPQIAPGVEVLEVETDTVDLDSARRYTRRYTITSFDEGETEIPALEVKIGSKSYHTNPISLSVATVEVDTTNYDRFFPPKTVQNVPFLWAEWNGVFWLSVLVVALLLVSVYLFVRLKQNKPIISRIIIVRHIPAHKKALTAIDQIKAEPDAADQKAYYTRLTDTLRQYIRERFGFNAMEMTSEEIIDRLRQSDETLIEELRELFRTADLVKFAKHQTALGEQDRNLLSAVNYIDQTKTDDQEREERIEPQLSQDDKRQQSQRLLARTLLFITAIGAAALTVYVAIAVSQLLY